jgi:hypothetical protein
MRWYNEDMRLPDEYMLTRDIDWFCCVEGQYLMHFASNGSLLPEFAANIEQLFFAQRDVVRMPFLFQGSEELRYNRGHIEELSRLEEYDEIRYLSSFELFASKGFYSFDYEWNREGEGGEYILIVGPGSIINEPEIEYFGRYLPQVYLRDLDERDRSMFERILNQIRRIE